MEGQSVTVRHATPDDAAAIADIAAEARFTPGRTGLLNILTAEQYAQRLESCPHSFLAIDAAGAPLAFLIAAAENARAIEPALDGVPQAASPGYLLIDQIAVSPQARGLGAARKLYDAAIAGAKPRLVSALIMHAPLRNERSIHFFTTRAGMMLQSEIPQPPYLWGYYEVRLPLQGLLVHGDNHFIVNGPRPSAEQARALLRQWERPSLPPTPADPASPWSICTKAFREELQWAVAVESSEPHSPAAAQLLQELAARGVEILLATAP